MRKKPEWGTTWDYSTSILSQNIKKMKGGQTFNFGKNLTLPKKLKGGTLWDFSTSFLSQNSKTNWRGDTLRKFFEKVSQCRKKLKGGPVLCYMGKQEKPFWFSSLGQIMQIGAKIFCRTSKNYFGQLVWIETKVTTRVAFHFMRRLKNNVSQTERKSKRG